MNYQILFYLLGWVMRFQAVFMLLPAGVAFYAGEPIKWHFLVTSLVVGVFGGLLAMKKPENMKFRGREGFALVAISWMLISAISAIPLSTSGAIPNYVDALFEMVSGFTTTGASILSAPESMPSSVNFWRCFSNWIGGMGMIVFMLTILPLAGSNAGMYMMKAESPGPSFGKLLPSLKKTAWVLYAMYLGLTVIEIILLVIGKVKIFEAICISTATAGTGGFGIRNDGFAGYSSYVQVVVTIFMFLFGVNFKFYFLLILRKIKEAFVMEEVRWYAIIYSAATALITIDIFHLFGNVGTALKHAAFQVATVMTTTGFATTDFDRWPVFSQTILVLLMCVGACAGSTGGGMKVSRLIIYFKSAMKEMGTLLHPNSVKKITVEGKPIPHETLRSANIYLIIYGGLMALSILLISLNGFDLVTTFTSVVATFNNIGPGLSEVGPTGNYGAFSMGSKLVLIFDMLVGRLEIFPMVILFLRDTWKR